MNLSECQKALKAKMISKPRKQRIKKTKIERIIEPKDLRNLKKSCKGSEIITTSLESKMNL